jgi:alanyl-tRNA synthetase
LPKNDNSLLFTNAGMNQFKGIITGQSETELKRVYNYQKCIRAGGKHNDLDDVGKDSYHHTFFEMLGNWSFNYNGGNIDENSSYFKEQAIDYAWDLLINVYGINPNRVYVTYFGGDNQLNLPADEETQNIWKKYLPDDRILPFDMKDNFWEMADTGPCGPCTEIHYDCLGDRDASSLVNQDDPTVIEVWNLVFMQYYRVSETQLDELQNQHVDTGMGFERLVAILQGAKSNYDTTVFKPLIEIIQKTIDGPDYQGRYGEDDVDNVDTAYRVLADHARTLIFSISDGVLPGKVGREYVVRKVIRRAIRYGQQVFDTQDGFLTQIIKAVCFHLGIEYPEITTSYAAIVECIQQEETLFSKTLRKATRKFKRLTKDGTLSGQNMLLLYMSFGLPQDFIEEMCRDGKITCQTDEFESLLEEQRQLSKK